VSDEHFADVIRNAQRAQCRSRDHRHLPELREAATLWAARLREIVEAKPGNVIPLRRKAV
jgi:hypothetical protein